MSGPVARPQLSLPISPVSPVSPDFKTHREADIGRFAELRLAASSKLCEKGTVLHFCVRVPGPRLLFSCEDIGSLVINEDNGCPLKANLTTPASTIQARIQSPALTPCLPRFGQVYHPCPGCSKCGSPSRLGSRSEADTIGCCSVTYFGCDTLLAL